jgi:glyoxylase-like metal-dependent hydrolase (beta-lactamase superfamily II)
VATIDLTQQSKMNILNVGYDSTNYYLIGQNTTQLLIDVGWPGTLPKLLNIFKRKRVPLQDVKYLLVTHYHPDHAGLAQEVKSIGTQLVVVENQLSFIPKLRTYMKPSNPFLEITLDDNLNLSFIDSREFLLHLGIRGEIIPTPGHSDDSISLILDEGIAFTGDLPGPTWGEDSMHQVETSWQRIRALNAKTIYPGHGPARILERDECLVS